MAAVDKRGRHVNAGIRYSDMLHKAAEIVSTEMA